MIPLYNSRTHVRPVWTALTSNMLQPVSLNMSKAVHP